ncbi:MULTISPECIES: YceI family protein [unclassified Luteimonas]
MNNRISCGVLAAALLASSVYAFAAPVTYQIDPTHTDVVAQWNHFGFSKPIAHFGEVGGSISYDPDNQAASSVEVVLPLAGLSSHVAAFDDHLRSADFFDAENFPQASFKSTSVRAAGEGKLAVAGNLTIKGITRPVVLDATINRIADNPMTGQPTAGFDAVATIKRTDFELGMFVPNVSDEVQLRITTEASVAKQEQ